MRNETERTEVGNGCGQYHRYSGDKPIGKWEKQLEVSKYINIVWLPRIILNISVWK